MAPKSSSQAALLSAYVEPLAASRRVVVIGAAAAELGERLLDLGARSVHAYESGPALAGGATRVIQKRLPDVREQDFDARDGAFDLAVLPDAASLRDVNMLLSRVRRLVGEAGVIVVGAAADGPLGYYELYDAVSLQFAEVAMVGEVPFRGAALAVLGDEGDPEVTVDTQLATEAAPPVRFLAVASQAPIDLRPYVIVQLPASEDAPSARSAPQLPVPPSSARLPASDSGLMTTPAPPPRSATSLEESEARERERASLIEAREQARAALAEARIRVEVLETQLEEERARASAAAERARQIEQSHVRHQEDARKLEGAARASEAARAQVEARLAEIERLLATREEHLANAIARAGELEAMVVRASELEANAVRAEQAQMAARALEAELIEIAEANAAEVAALEDALRERGRVIHEMERELVRRERMVKELLTAVSEHAHAPAAHAPAAHTAAASPAVAASAPPELLRALEGAKAEIQQAREVEARLRAQIEAVSIDAARREGELQALRWRIDELELGRDVEGESSVPSVASAPTQAAPILPSAQAEIDRLRDELDALRQALRQEHEARLRAEKGRERAAESGAEDAATG